MEKKPLRVIVGGGAGRMGRRLSALLAEDPRFVLTGGVVRTPEQARSLARCFTADALSAHLERSDLLIDFSAPQASVAFASAAAKAGKPAVIGTTGLSALQQAQLAALAKKVPLFAAANFSPGVHALLHLAEEAARLLGGFEVSLSETHHSRKKDSPSGTALRLAQAVARARGGKLPEIVSQRVGDVVGDHALTLAGKDERLELVHRAQSRDVFARGAMDAALWLRRRRPGLYGMDDLLRAR
ncbi:MAG: 4-hydroxy-tetrahydrodipicolinate reductase [Elusimicrobiota bacterium]